MTIFIYIPFLDLPLEDVHSVIEEGANDLRLERVHELNVHYPALRLRVLPLPPIVLLGHSRLDLPVVVVDAQVLDGSVHVALLDLHMLPSVPVLLHPLLFLLLVFEVLEVAQDVLRDRNVRLLRSDEGLPSILLVLAVLLGRPDLAPQVVIDHLRSRLQDQNATFGQYQALLFPFQEELLEQRHPDHTIVCQLLTNLAKNVTSRFDALQAKIATTYEIPSDIFSLQLFWRRSYLSFSVSFSLTFFFSMICK
mmetsp:Transcript_24613/g.24202  ORF Transcript_24613/g.24202 Transcript_24613/m.24202 type:complete len:251 (-) Transcript_24613:135-887(-)